VLEAELLVDERKEMSAALRTQVNAWFAGCGIRARNTLSDNGSRY